MRTHCASGHAGGLLRGRIYNRTKKQGQRTDLTSPQIEEKSATTKPASQQAVSKAMNTTESPQCGKQVVIPAHIAANKNSKTDFLKLTPEGQDRVRQGGVLLVPKLAQAKEKVTNRKFF
jgi:hypothetical protein